MHQLRELIGRDHETDSLNRRLRDFVASQRGAAVGALLVTCADECEAETADSFQHWFADPLLPELKTWRTSPFRLANLGARYEWGALPVAEAHYALPGSKDHFKTMFVKLNSHVAVERQNLRPVFGRMDRYSVPSTYCGALHALMDNQSGPAMDELRHTFASEDKPRLEMLNDPDQIEPDVRAILAAIVNARLQARRVVVEVQHHTPCSPTFYIIVATVTLNRPQRDTEIVVGYYLADHRNTARTVQYQGLEDDPSRLQVAYHHGHIRISDRGMDQPRVARDHGEEVLQLWIERRERASTRRDPRIENDPQVEKIAKQAARLPQGDSKLTRELLSTFVWLLLDLAPIPTSILLFGKGVAGAHHLYTAHQLARGKQDVPGARAIVSEFLGRLDALPTDTANEVLDTLLRHHLGNVAKVGL